MSLTRIRKTFVFIHFVQIHCGTGKQVQRMRHGYDLGRTYEVITFEIDRETLLFHVDACLGEQEDIYGTVINELDKDNLPISLYDIYEEMNTNNFGRIMVHLTLVYKVSDIMDEETTREVIRRTTEGFKRIDLAKYNVRSSNEV